MLLVAIHLKFDNCDGNAGSTLTHIRFYNDVIQCSKAHLSNMDDKSST